MLNKPNINKEKYGTNSKGIPKRPNISSGHSFHVSSNTKFNKPNKNKKIKVFLICCIILFSVLLVGWTMLFVYINYIKEYRVDLQTPSIEIVSLHNGTVLSSTIIDGAIGYEFLVSNDNGNEISLYSDKNSIVLGNYLKEAGVYNIKVRAVAGKHKYYSEYSDSVEYINYKKLNAPEIYTENLDAISENGKIVAYSAYGNTDDDLITWENDENAIGYKIIYGVNANTGDLLYYYVPQSGANICQFNLSQVYTNGVGEYLIYLVAVASDNTLLLDSDFSNVLQVKYFVDAVRPIDAKYDMTNNSLTFKTTYSKYVEKFQIKIEYQGDVDEKYYILSAEDIILNRGNYIEYQVNFSPILEGDILNVYIRTISENDYVFSSDWIKVQLY